MKLKEEILELKARKRIYNFILKYPGLHLRELIRKLNIPDSTLRYHLRHLNKRGLIKTNSEEGYVRFYITNSLGNAQKKMFHILRQEIPRNIILYLLSSSCTSQIELSKSLEKHPKTIEFHLKKLLKMGIIEPAPIVNREVRVELGSVKIIERAPVGKEIIYRLKDPYLIKDSIILYQKRSLDDTFCDDYINCYNFWHWGSQRHGRNKQGKHIVRSNSTKFLEAAEKRFFDIFPHPYHV